MAKKVARLAVFTHLMVLLKLDWKKSAPSWCTSGRKSTFFVLVWDLLNYILRILVTIDFSLSPCFAIYLSLSRHHRTHKKVPRPWRPIRNLHCTTHAINTNYLRFYRSSRWPSPQVCAISGGPCADRFDSTTCILHPSSHDANDTSPSSISTVFDKLLSSIDGDCVRNVLLHELHVAYANLIVSFASSSIRDTTSLLTSLMASTKSTYATKPLAECAAQDVRGNRIFVRNVPLFHCRASILRLIRNKGK